MDRKEFWRDPLRHAMLAVPQGRGVWALCAGQIGRAHV